MDHLVWREQACLTVLGLGYWTLRGLTPSVVARLLREQDSLGHISAPFVVTAVLALYERDPESYSGVTLRELRSFVRDEAVPMLREAGLTLTCLHRPECYALEPGSWREAIVREIVDPYVAG